MSKENPFEKEYSRPMYEPVSAPQTPAVKPLPKEEPVIAQMGKGNNFNEVGVPFLKEVNKNPGARRIAKENGVYVGSPAWHNFLIIFFTLALIGGICFGSWGVYNDKFKTEVSVNMTCPVIEIPACPILECADVTCPQQTCEVTCPSFPGEININLDGNSSG